MALGGSWAYLILWTHKDNNYYVTTTSENDPNAGRTEPLQLVIEGGHIKKDKGSRDVVRNQTPGMTDEKWEGHDKHQELRGSDPILGIPGPGTHTEKMSPHNIWPWKSAGFNFRRPRQQ